MNRHFGNIDRIELSTVVNQWKRYHGFIKEVIKLQKTRRRLRR